MLRFFLNSITCLVGRLIVPNHIFDHVEAVLVGQVFLDNVSNDK